MCSIRKRAVSWFVIGFLLCFFIGSTAVAGDKLKITKSKWNAENGVLIVKGKGQKKIEVVLSDTSSTLQLSTTTTSKKGKWKIKVENLSTPPCSVTVSSGTQTAVRTVKKAPADCSGALVAGSAPTSSSNVLTVTESEWEYKRDILEIKGRGQKKQHVVVTDTDTAVELGTATVSKKGKWKLYVKSLTTSPCSVTVTSASETVVQSVKHAPADCSTTPPTEPPSSSTMLTITESEWEYEKDVLEVEGRGQKMKQVVITDTDSGIELGTTTVSKKGKWELYVKSLTTPPCSVTATSASETVVQSVKHAPADCSTTPPTEPPTQPPSDVASINSTSANGIPGSPVAEQSMAGDNAYQIFAINDLGMHCGDLDTRISSILPPFNVLHATVIRRGNDPSVLSPGDGIRVVYSAASNPNDPILTGMNSAGTGPFASSLLPDGSVYKTNFWETVQLGAYDPFYPPENPFTPAFDPLTPLAGPPFNVITDVGLPMPNVELLHLHTPPVLTATQQMMPGISAPYSANVPQEFTQFVTDQPFFINPAFQFGYVKEGVDWFEAAGLPLTAYDDFGRENPWPLYRIQALQGNTLLASVDTVVPISGEANCGFCHNDPDDGGNGSATQRLFDNTIDIALANQDTANVPEDVSKEWAADLNLLRLHDLKHGSGIDVPKYTPDLVDQTPVVCQTCHYTPALDLAQLGPLGEQNDPGNVLHNGRDQIVNKSMSNVMHSHHATVTSVDGIPLFPDMPDAIKDQNGDIVNLGERREVLEATCYQCHPGRRTDCLRGAMSNGGMLCQDCHGDMNQVGDDFTRGVSAATPGAFELGGDFYTNPDQPRVPWANEPGCGSCHTGDAMDNLAGADGTVVNNYDADANQDGIRLFKAYLSGDAKATPIVPTNKRFAENVIAADNPAVTGPDDTRIGNPMLYRVSTGHEGIFCEACHGATHGIWPNKNPLANDNVTSNQLQGHTGTIIECSTCHEGDLGNTLEGPHGMHPVGDTSFSDGGHENLAGQNNGDECRACHGRNGEGTVLARAATDECNHAI
ncbi:MAG: cytochrome C [gamma proteobacterium symbiont of Bathyaustriella thionipta]|nr:cytochrome C [gamma proteobacterium symbiont of Bathyaustriella thionipta]MCU7951367.1 cytochrome C [gamma proteobacterium symbiont of Bathyaustriella thionipta]MCU7952106.1 cytochrome C [gamma proteobacterium symbiont of Bathyaustriella thionipta]MCU7957918.1 cytochrome C [gamma proteobacterium symbiont of Bathyaustriella thionipta]MCU7966247.1 cytochrome C [gamma proteobacterium symbiont of Bathyaustriella thionipta]